jgi:hypothetical protein
VENATCKYDIRNRVHASLATWIPNDDETDLQHSKTTLNIFAASLLSLCKVFVFLVVGLVDALNKAILLWIYSIRQQVVPVVLFSIHLEGEVTSLASDQIVDQWRTVKHIEVII